MNKLEYWSQCNIKSTTCCIIRIRILVQNIPLMDDFASSSFSTMHTIVCTSSPFLLPPSPSLLPPRILGIQLGIGTSCQVLFLGNWITDMVLISRFEVFTGIGDPGFGHDCIWVVKITPSQGPEICVKKHPCDSDHLVGHVIYPYYLSRLDICESLWRLLDLGKSGIKPIDKVTLN